MRIKARIKKDLNQILALTEKNLKLASRFKLDLIMGLLMPLITIAMPLIIMVKYFPETNLFIYQFIAYQVYLLKGIVVDFPSQLRIEKYWKTLPALIVGPFNRLNWLFGIFFSRIILISIPFTILLILTYISSPIHFVTLIFIIGIFFIIALIFSGIGLIFGVFAISKENLWRPSLFIFNIIFWFSCITYPFNIFPTFFQNFISINPFYYIFEFLRLTWLENNILFTISSHTFHFYFLILTGLVIPIIGVYSFNFVYKKFGIVGY